MYMYSMTARLRLRIQQLRTDATFLSGVRGKTICLFGFLEIQYRTTVASSKILSHYS
jgi:hypothetical protein